MRGSFVLAVIVLITGSEAIAQRQMENLNRGIIASSLQELIRYILDGGCLELNRRDFIQRIYRQNGNEKPVKLNKKPIVESTNYVDGSANLLTENKCYIQTILKGKEQAKSNAFILNANSPVQQYINIPLRTPAGYTPNDISVGDLDGDGDYELILHQTGRSIDTPSTGISGIPIFQAYKTDGTFLWEISLGKKLSVKVHIIHNSWFTTLTGMVFRNLHVKTADGTTDGTGKVLGDSTKDWRNLDKASGLYYGKILDGPEFFTIFSGKNGEALATTNYIPQPLSS